MHTDFGEFKRDESGLWHYQNHMAAGILASVVEDAIRNHPKEAAWFWFNGTPAPILANDNRASLIERWVMWRAEWQKAQEMLALVTKYTGVSR